MQKLPSFPVAPSFTYIATKLGRRSHGGMGGRVELSVVVLRDHLEEKGVGVGGHIDGTGGS